MNEKQSYMLIGASSALAFGVGAGVYLGYFLAKKNLEPKYAAIAAKEIAEAKQFYSILHKKDEFETPEAAVEAFGLLEKAAEALTTYQGKEIIENVDVEIPPEQILRNVFAEAQSDNDFDYDEELKTRTSEQPYVISHDEFMENDGEFIQISLTYYDGDDVLADDKDKPLDDPDVTVGEDNLLRFGHGSKDTNMVYIRNEKLDLDFEVLRSTGKYVEEVLGFIEHSDRRTKIRRFRGDDE